MPDSIINFSGYCNGSGRILPLDEYEWASLDFSYFDAHSVSCVSQTWNYTHAVTSTAMHFRILHEDYFSVGSTATNTVDVNLNLYGEGNLPGRLSIVYPDRQVTSAPYSTVYNRFDNLTFSSAYPMKFYADYPDDFLVRLSVDCGYRTEKSECAFEDQDYGTIGDRKQSNGYMYVPIPVISSIPTYSKLQIYEGSVSEANLRETFTFSSAGTSTNAQPLEETPDQQTSFWQSIMDYAIEGVLGGPTAWYSAFQTYVVYLASSVAELPPFSYFSAIRDAYIAAIVEGDGEDQLETYSGEFEIWDPVNNATRTVAIFSFAGIADSRATPILDAVKGILTIVLLAGTGLHIYHSIIEMDTH